MKDNNFNFNQVFLNTLDSKQLLSFSYLENINTYISEKSLSILLAKTSFALLLISMLSYWFQMSFKSEIVMKSDYAATGVKVSEKKLIDKKNFFEKVPFVTMWSANITLAILLSIRWIESGHFPLSNLYESLIFLSWSLTVIHIFLENLFHKKNLGDQILWRGASDSTLTLGAITSPVALFTNAFATFSLPQEMQKVTVLVPALKSNWLIMHVSVMIISYAALLSGSLLSMAFLVVKFLNSNKIGISSWLKSNTTFFSSRTFFSFQRLQDPQKESDSKLITPNHHSPEGFALPPASYARQALKGYRGKQSEQSRHSETPSFGVKNQLDSFQTTSINKASDWENDLLPTPSSYTKPTFISPRYLSRRVCVGNLNVQSKESDQKALCPSSFVYPALQAPSGYAKLEGACKAGYAKPAKSVDEGLTSRKKNKVLLKNFQFLDLLQILDNLSYRCIGLGFALLTIGILSGAVWANEAWGSYWSWDPKETWAFITWLIFALYLHTRLSKGWAGKESAFVASFGFVVIWFCYLGVNLFGKGLHSYGWFQQ